MYEFRKMKELRNSEKGIIIKEEEDDEMEKNENKIKIHAVEVRV